MKFIDEKRKKKKQEIVDVMIKFLKNYHTGLLCLHVYMYQFIYLYITCTCKTMFQLGMWGSMRIVHLLRVCNVGLQSLYQDFQGLQIAGYGQPPTSEQVLDSFKTALTALISQPGNMEELMSGVIDQINQLPATAESIQNKVVEMLFEQVVCNCSMYCKYG